VKKKKHCIILIIIAAVPNTIQLVVGCTYMSCFCFRTPQLQLARSS
jgi:hypothetical protein